MTMGCSGEEEGVLGAVYRGEGELSESLVSIPYLAMMVDAHNSQSSGERVFYCKGNLAVPRKSLRSSKGGSKENISEGIIHER
jgi:hypothetical protein